MAVNRSLKWIIGVALVVALSLVPGTCIRWEADEQIQAAAERAEAAEAEAAAFRVQRDSALQVAFQAAVETDAIKRRYAAIRREVPPAPPPVAGCEPCQERAAVLEEALETADSVIAAQNVEIDALGTAAAMATLGAKAAEEGLAAARAELQRLAQPKPVVRTSWLRQLLPQAQIGYSAVLSLEEEAMRLRHGPSVSVGWRISL